MSKTELKLEGLTLAAKSRILKRLARSRQYHPDQRKAFEHQRVHAVRSEARSLHLALGFLRGRGMDEMEQPLRAKNCGHISTVGMTRTAPNWVRVEELVNQYGQRYFSDVRELSQRFAEFKAGQEEITVFEFVENVDT